MKRNYIGLASTIHDSAIAIVNSKGEVVFAEATERCVQSKRAINMSPDQYHYLYSLLKTHIEPEAELTVAHTWSDKIIDILKKSLSEVHENEAKFEKVSGNAPFFAKQYLAQMKYLSASGLNTIQQASNTLEFLISQREELQRFGGYVTKRYDHHLTHAATACFTGPFKEACCVILDGYGETRAYNCYHYQDGKISELPGMVRDNVASLGMFYSLVCDICGFDFFSGEEWKVMGLAAYGRFDQPIYDLFKSFLQVDGVNLKQCSNEQLFLFLKKVNSLKRKKEEPVLKAANLAYNGQLVFTEILFEFLRNLYQLGLSENLIMGGGCSLNSSANGMITENTGFKNHYNFSAPGDDGNAIGAALLAYYEDHPGEPRTPGFQTPYLGAVLSEYKIGHLIRFGRFKKMKQYPDDIHYQAARLLAAGKIIGWVQGRAEFGPRALGNRSILADPRSPHIKDIINDRVKFREEYRPLAPSVLHELAPEYFENYHESPYMERTLRFRDKVKSKVPGVVHEDGTGRLQTVKREWNEKYYDLIKAFYDITGIPMVLNTSFNVMGKPIVHSVEDAIAVFYTSGLDALIIGDLLIEKED